MSEKQTKKKDAGLEALILKVQELTDKIAAMQSAPAATPKKKSKKGEPRPDVFFLIKGVPSATAEWPPQFKRVIKCLAAAAPEGGKMTEVEVFEALMGAGNKLGPWNYAQDPFYIFRYYRAKMIAAQYVLGPFDAD